MPLILKRILSILLLVIFLIPSAGILIYMRHCNSSGKTQLSIESLNCCPKHSLVSQNAVNEDNLLNSYAKHTFSKGPCCDNANVYIKLGFHLAVDRLLVNPLPAIITTQKYEISSVMVSLSQKRNDGWMNYPPWQEVYLKNSSLRL